MCSTGSVWSCPILCGPVNCSPPGSSAHGVLQERILGGLPCPLPGTFPTRGDRPVSRVSPAGGFFTASATPSPYSSNLSGPFCHGIPAYLVYIPLTCPAPGWFWFPTTMRIMKIINILLMKTIKQPISICRNTCNFKILWKLTSSL